LGAFGHLVGFENPVLVFVEAREEVGGVEATATTPLAAASIAPTTISAAALSATALVVAATLEATPTATTLCRSRLRGDGNNGEQHGGDLCR
jgi:hypothetical protein